MNVSCRIFTLFLAWLVFGVSAVSADTYPEVGEVERFSPAMDVLLARDAVVERLTEDRFRWSEGPVWIPDGNYLLFSDVPENTMWKWSETGGLEVFLRPSALVDGTEENSGKPGTNGLILLQDGRVLAADHGSRSLYTLDPATRQRLPGVTDFAGKRFNSPNDLVLSRQRWPGTVFFTDPPYGLEGQDESPLKELEFSGVFRLDPDGAVTLLDDTLSRPNGIGLSPDETVLYVASSDLENLEIRAYDLDDAGAVRMETQSAANIHLLPFMPGVNLRDFSHLGSNFLGLHIRNLRYFKSIAVKQCNIENFLKDLLQHRII